MVSVPITYGTFNCYGGEYAPPEGAGVYADFDASKSNTVYAIGANIKQLCSAVNYVIKC